MGVAQALTSILQTGGALLSKGGRPQQQEAVPICKAEFRYVSYDLGGYSSSHMIMILPDKPQPWLSQPRKGLAIWRFSVQSRFATLCHVPRLCLARHSFPLPLSPSRAAGSLLTEAEEQGTLFHVCAPPSRPALMERFAIAVETNFTANCSGYRWGHLGVCIVCGNCFISAGKENTYYHVFAADGGFCVGTLAHQRKRD